jgi:predicted nucleic acid-binding protein
MIILDTNVVSALMKPIENGAVVAWLDQQPSVSVWTTAITILEVRFGLMLLPSGRRRMALEKAFDAVITEDLEDRVLAFDSAAADAAASLAVTYRRTGRQVDTSDIQIAGIAVARKATIATRNVKDFDDPSIQIINPWRPI